MFGEKKKLFKEMTTEEKLKAVRKMSSDELYCLLDMQELSLKEQKAVIDELNRRDNKNDKTSKAVGVTAIIAALALGAVELISRSAEKD